MTKYDTVTVQCWFCRRDVKYPSGKYRRGQPVFCSLKCNRKFVARDGEEQQQNLEQYGRSTTD